MARREELTDDQWAIIKPLIPEPRRRADGRGRPWRDAREVLNGILWILRSGAGRRSAGAWGTRPRRTKLATTSWLIGTFGEDDRNSAGAGL
jgi:transposase